MKKNYTIPMIEVNNRLKKEYDRGRLEEAENIFETFRDSGFNLVWLAARCVFLKKSIESSSSHPSRT